MFPVCRDLRHLRRKSVGAAPAPEYTQSGVCGARGFPGKTGKPSPPAPAAECVGMVEKREKEFRRYFFLRRKLFSSSRRGFLHYGRNDKEDWRLEFFSGAGEIDVGEGVGAGGKLNGQAVLTRLDHKGNGIASRGRQ